MGGATANRISLNVISDNFGAMFVSGSGTSGNVVLGNLIGTDVHGTAALGNHADGIRIEGGATANTVGGTTAGNANVIADTIGTGVEISGSGTSGNVVLGNLIGTDIHGTATRAGQLHLGNLLGVFMGNGATANTLGGATFNAPNVISGNGVGVEIRAGSGNVVLGNFIGTDVHGTANLGNVFQGVWVVDGSVANTIGGTDPGAANIISVNGSDGVELTGVRGNVVLGNLIGTDVTGTAKLANSGNGILLTKGANANTIGGTDSGAGNVLSANGSDGVELRGVSGNVVLGNLIGTDVKGTAKLGNARFGVALNSGATANTIGGVALNAANVISGNLDGVGLVGTGTGNNVVEGNLIGTDLSGEGKLGNTYDGILLQNPANGNTIGGLFPDAGNVVSGNGSNGIDLVGPGAQHNLVAGNLIGTDAGGTANLGNSAEGIRLSAGASNNTIGGLEDGGGNTIAFNLKGVVVGSSGNDIATNNDTILGNSIFLNLLSGIDLGDDGLGSHGPNHNQPPPVLSSISNGQILGTLKATPNTTYRVEFFQSLPMPAGALPQALAVFSGKSGLTPFFTQIQGQGTTFVTFLNVSTNGSGVAAFQIPVGLFGNGSVVTVTATKLTGNGSFVDTSEFSGGLVMP